MSGEPDLLLPSLGRLAARLLAASEAARARAAEDQASERDNKGRLRWLRADGTRP